MKFLHALALPAAPGQNTVVDFACIARRILINSWFTAKVIVNQAGCRNSVGHGIQTGMWMQHVNSANVSMDNVSLVHRGNAPCDLLKVADF
jgi:hypothetical protein